jgi:hypothetical protein
MPLATRRVVGRWWQSLNQQNYYKSAANAAWCKHVEKKNHNNKIAILPLN